MSIGQSLLPEYDAEMANTRKLLERVPADKLGWKAHPKSNTIGWVAMHLAEIPGWAETTLTTDSFDVAPPGGEPYRTPPAESVAGILALFDKNVAAGRAAIAASRDEDYPKPWSLLAGGKDLFTMPKGVVLRSFVFSHAIHHRAVLCVYLRLNDIPVPGMYGPSGDE
jgi:uncharacterized damage-inducible protein DinB